MTKPTASRNLIATRLAANEPAYILAVRQARTVDIVGIAQATGHHGFYIDLQHCTMPVDIAAQICHAGLLAGITPMVRLPRPDASLCEIMLEAGAQGIILPDVRSADEARELASWCRFPPRGVRSSVGVGPHTRFAPADQGRDRPRVEADTLTFAMLESEAGIDAADDIASVDGIDLMLIGTNDLTSSMGIPGQYEHPRVQEAYGRALAAAAKHGKRVMVGGIRDPRIVASYVKAGAARCFVSGFDSALLAAGARAQLDAYKNI